MRERKSLDVDEIKRRHDAGQSDALIAVALGVPESAVRKITQPKKYNWFHTGGGAVCRQPVRFAIASESDENDYRDGSQTCS